MPNTTNSMKQKKRFFLMRSPKVMRAGTGNKNFFIWPYQSFDVIWWKWINASWQHVLPSRCTSNWIMCQIDNSWNAIQKEKFYVKLIRVAIRPSNIYTFKQQKFPFLQLLNFLNLRFEFKSNVLFVWDLEFTITL